MQPKFNSDGLIPVVTTDAYSGQVLMQAYMNSESYGLTLSTGYAHYYSRSRSKLWKKGEESGNVQKVVSIHLDCDCDCVLLRVKQTGVACHTGKESCFFNEVKTFENIPNAKTLYDDRTTIIDRIHNPVEGSYTNYLFSKGLDKICKKISEEAGEVIIAAKNNNKTEISQEVADLIFHIQVLLQQTGVTLEDVFTVIADRASKERTRNY